MDVEPTIDMMGVDPRRFGDYAGRGFLIEKNGEAYARVFSVHYPDEERDPAIAMFRSWLISCFGALRPAPRPDAQG